jgi:hypothetical protein
MAHGRHHGLSLEAVCLFWDTDVVVLRVPCAGGEGSKAEDCLIQVKELKTFGFCFIEACDHLLEEVAVVAALNLNRRLCAPYALVGDLELAIDSADESWRDMDLWKLPMEHDGSLLQREVSPVIEGPISSQILYMLEGKLPSSSTFLILGACALSLRVCKECLDPIACGSKDSSNSRVVKKRYQVGSRDLSPISKKEGQP